MRQLLQIGHLVRIVAIVIAGVLLVACGSEEADETPTPSIEAVDAEPTVNVAATSETTPVSTPGATAPELPEHADMSTMVVEESPAVTVAAATPSTGVAAATAIPSWEAATATPVNADATLSNGAATPLAGVEEVPAAPPFGDGTTGAMIAAPPAASPPTVQASPASSPVVQATPGIPLTVTGCDVASVPPFASDVTQFRLTTDVNFRTGPGVDCDLALDQPIGAFQIVEVIGGPVIRQDEDTEWVQIRVLDTDGWVAFEFLEPVEP